MYLGGLQLPEVDACALEDTKSYFVCLSVCLHDYHMCECVLAYMSNHPVTSIR